MDIAQQSDSSVGIDDGFMPFESFRHLQSVLRNRMSWTRLHDVTQIPIVSSTTDVSVGGPGDLELSP